MMPPSPYPSVTKVVNTKKRMGSNRCNYEMVFTKFQHENLAELN